MQWQAKARVHSMLRRLVDTWTSVRYVYYFRFIIVNTFQILVAGGCRQEQNLFGCFPVDYAQNFPEVAKFLSEHVGASTPHVFSKNVFPYEAVTELERQGYALTKEGGIWTTFDWKHKSLMLPTSFPQDVLTWLKLHDTKRFRIFLHCYNFSWTEQFRYLLMETGNTTRRGIAECYWDVPASRQWQTHLPSIKFTTSSKFYIWTLWVKYLPAKTYRYVSSSSSFTYLVKDKSLLLYDTGRSDCMTFFKQYFKEKFMEVIPSAGALKTFQQAIEATMKPSVTMRQFCEECPQW